MHKKRFSYESVSKEDTNEVCKSGDKIPLHVSRGGRIAAKEILLMET